MTCAEFRARLADLLAKLGSRIGEPNLRLDTRECYAEIRKDTIAHGGHPDVPFFNLLCLEDVAIFTFFEQTCCMYLVRGGERKIIADTAHIAMVETESCKCYLREVWGRESPDLWITREAFEEWIR